jgi:cellulose biosynthesis protein BcsQ
MKGGVGKTTITVGLALALAKLESDAAARKVLVVDLDAQANASFWLCGDEALTQLITSGRTLDAFLEDTVVFRHDRGLRDFVHSSRCDPNVSVIACSPELRLVEREMISLLSQRRGDLKQVEKTVSDLLIAQLNQLKGEFDIIIFDTAPGISALTEAALRASNLVVVPTIPDFISNLGLEAFCHAVWWASRHNGEAQRAPWVVANRVKDTAAHTSMLRAMRAEAAAEDAGFGMFRVQIPYSVSLEAASARACESSDPGVLFDDSAATLFKALAGEVLEQARAPKSAKNAAAVPAAA